MPAEPVEELASKRTGTPAQVGFGPTVNRATRGVLVSTVKSSTAGSGSTAPLELIARTANVCAPSGRGAVACGLVHASNAAVSTRHSNVVPVLSEPNVNVGV